MIVNVSVCPDYSVYRITVAKEEVGCIRGQVPCNSYFAKYRIKRKISQFKQTLYLAESTSTHIKDYNTHTWAVKSA